MTGLTIRPATKDDISAFSTMANKPTVRAYVGKVGDRIVGLGGLALVKGRWFLFLDLTDEGRSHKIALMRMAKRVLAEAKELGIRFVYAEADPDEAKAVAWLARLGFQLDVRSQHLYRWSA